MEPVTINQGSRNSTHFNNTTQQQTNMPSPRSNTRPGDVYYNEDNNYVDVDQKLLIHGMDDGKLYDDTENPENLSVHVTDVLSGTRQSFKKHLENMLAGKPPPIVKQNSLGSISSNTENKPQLQIPPLPTRSRGSLPPTPTLQEQLYEELPPNSIPEDETD